MVATRTYTVDELERTPPPGDWSANDWELVDGEVVLVTPAGGESSGVGAEILMVLGLVVRPNRLGKLYGADAGFKVFPDRETLLSPDVAFVNADRVPTGKAARGFLHLAPDLAVEVLSPSDSRAAALRKGMMYIDAGVRLVWLVDPLRRIIVVLTPDDLPLTLREGDALDGGDVLPGLAVPVADVFR